MAHLRQDGNEDHLIQDWYTDNRGDHTLHSAVFVDKYVRFMWISYRNLGQYRDKPPEKSRQDAEQTRLDMIKLMNHPSPGLFDGEPTEDESQSSDGFDPQMEALLKLLQ